MRSSRAAFRLLAPAAALLLSCGDGPGGRAAPAGPEGPPPVYGADPLAEGNPFPDDRLLASGRLQLPPPLATVELPADARYDGARAFVEGPLAASLRSRRGFSPLVQPTVGFSAPVEPASTAGVRLLGPDGAVDAAVRLDGQTVRLVPRHVLAGGTTYHLVVTRDVLAAEDGAPVGRPAAFDPASAEPCLAAADRAGVARRQVSLCTSFTTQPIADGLLAARDSLDAAPPAQRGLRPVDDPSIVRLVTEGVLGGAWLVSFDSPDMRGAGGTFDEARLAGGGERTTLEALVVTPVGAGPFPVLIAQHGLSGSKEQVLEFADRIAGEGVAIVAIDAVDHGSRGSGDPRELVVFDDLPATRDKLRQTVVDMLAVRRLVASGVDLDGDGRPDLEDDVRFVGASFGGLLGTMYLAVESRVRVGYLGMAGARLPELVHTAVLLPGILEVPFAARLGLDLQDPLWPDLMEQLLPRLQWLIDEADPIHYAALVTGRRRPPLPGTPPKSVLLTEGVEDFLIPNWATEALADEMELPVDVALSGEGGVSAMWRIDPEAYGKPRGLISHSYLVDIPQSQDQLRAYLISYGTELPPLAPP